MSEFSRKYQEQISKKTAVFKNGKWEFEEYAVDGVHFDGYDEIRNVLLDAKGKYTSLLESGLAQAGLEKEVRAQLSKANGVPIEWHCAIQKDAELMLQYFNSIPDLAGKIRIIFTPQNF